MSPRFHMGYLNSISRPVTLIALLLSFLGSVHSMPLRSILRSNNVMMVVVIVHMLSQLLNSTLATNFVVGTDDGLSTEDMCILL